MLFWALKLCAFWCHQVVTVIRDWAPEPEASTIRSKATSTCKSRVFSILTIKMQYTDRNIHLSYVNRTFHFTFHGGRLELTLIVDPLGT